MRVDLLLAHVPSGRPIVCELKIANDKDPYTGLVQALAGASQLVSHAQRRRLDTHSGPLALPDDEPRIDVYVLLGAYPTTGRHRFRQLGLAVKLASELETQPQINQHIARIRILSLCRHPDGTASASTELPAPGSE